MSRGVSRDVSSAVSSAVSRDVSRDVPRDVSKNVSRNVSRNVSKSVSRDVYKGVSSTVPRDVSKSVSRDVSKGVSWFLCQLCCNQPTSTLHLFRADDKVPSVSTQMRVQLGQPMWNGEVKPGDHPQCSKLRRGGQFVVTPKGQPRPHRGQEIP